MKTDEVKSNVDEERKGSDKVKPLTEKQIEKNDKRLTTIEEERRKMYEKVKNETASIYNSGEKKKGLLLFRVIKGIVSVFYNVAQRILDIFRPKVYVNPTQAEIDNFSKQMLEKKYMTIPQPQPEKEKEIHLFDEYVPSVENPYVTAENRIDDVLTLTPVKKRNLIYEYERKFGNHPTPAQFKKFIADLVKKGGRARPQDIAKLLNYQLKGKHFAVGFNEEKNKFTLEFSHKNERKTIYIDIDGTLSNHNGIRKATYGPFVSLYKCVLPLMNVTKDEINKETGNPNHLQPVAGTHAADAVLYDRSSEELTRQIALESDRAKERAKEMIKANAEKSSEIKEEKQQPKENETAIPVIADVADFNNDPYINRPIIGDDIALDELLEKNAKVDLNEDVEVEEASHDDNEER